MDLGEAKTFDRAAISEPYGRVREFKLQVKDGDAWKTFHRGTTIGESFDIKFAPVTGRHVRRNLLKIATPFISLLIRSGHTQTDVATFLGVHPNSVWRWMQAYRDQGMAGLRARAAAGRPPKLSAAQDREVRRPPRCPATPWCSRPRG